MNQSGENLAVHPPLTILEFILTFLKWGSYSQLMRDKIGIANRREVHKKGFWHETFHCWFIKLAEEKTYIYFQLRSKEKKDYPDLLDITAAGHLLAHESVADGIREVKEETGIAVRFEQLHPIGTIRYKMAHDALLDNEMAHTFLYHYKSSPDHFILDRKEVAAMVWITLEDFLELWEEERGTLIAEGIDADRQPIAISVTKELFVPHDTGYYEQVMAAIRSFVEIGA